MRDSLALYLCSACETKRRKAVRLYTRVHGTSNTGTLCINSLIFSNGNEGNGHSFDYSLLKKMTPLVTPFTYNAVIPITAYL